MMKKNYNINRNYKPPSKEDIAKQKDFAALLNRFEAQKAVAPPAQRSPLRVVPWIGALAAAALVAGWFFFVNTGKSAQEYQKQNAAHFAQADFINPPLDKVPAAQFTSTKINANTGGVYEHVTGSRILIPKSAFVNDKGALIEGEVDIKYREFHDYVDFFLSGIPMTYDSAGVQYTLESAGMIEVYAEQNGQRVRIAPGKDLDVELVSYLNIPTNLNVPPDYNIYRLDEEANAWIYTDVDKIQILEGENDLLDPDDPATGIIRESREELKALKRKEERELAALEASIPQITKPIKPQSTNGSDSVFDLDFANNPEMSKLYKNSLWQFSPRSSVQANEVMKNVEDAQLKKLSDTEYQITFTAGNRSQIVIVNPVLTGADYDNALAIYNEKLVEYNRLQAEREARLSAEKADLQSKIAEEKRLVSLKYDAALSELRARDNTNGAIDLMVRRKVVNRFRATEFGVWNCDRPLPPNEQLLQASFVTDKGKRLDNMTAYVVDKSRNTVNRFLATDDARFAFNRNSQNLLWVVTEDNKIAVFRDEDFKNIPIEKEEFTFVLKEVNKEIENEEDVREILYL